MSSPKESNGPVARQKTSTYRALLLIFCGFALLAVFSTLALSHYLKKQTINELATLQAEQEAGIIFKALWQGMLQGWDKNDMNHFIHSLELNSHEKQVQLIRSALLDDQFGQTDTSIARRKQDPAIKGAMQSGQKRIMHTNGEIRYLYPIVATEACISCHINSSPGAVHGVIDIRFSDQPMQRSLNQTFNAYMAATLIILLALCMALFYIVRLRIVRPLRQLSRQIRQAVKDDLSVGRINADCYRLREPFQLAQSFNQLAQELDDYHDQLKENSYIDALTGLYNRRYFNEQMPNLLKKSRSVEQPLTLMLIDLDRFKAINDTYGHEAGDLALSFFAQTLQSQVKPDDLVIRLGGDEFVIVLTQTSISGALSIKRRLNAALYEKRANLGVVHLHIEASTGYATYPNDATGVETLMQQADRAMYHDKQARRLNRSQTDNPVTETT